MFRTGYRVCDAMNRKPVAVPPDATIYECAQLLRDNLASSLIVKENETIIGYVTDEDIVRKIVAHGINPAEAIAADAMSHKIVVVEPDKDIYYALMLMKKYDVRQVPVIDRETNRLIGLLTVRDILSIEPQLIELLVEKKETSSGSSIVNLEGSCDSCGKYSERLYELGDGFMCGKCREKAPNNLKKDKSFASDNLSF